MGRPTLSASRILLLTALASSLMLLSACASTSASDGAAAADPTSGAVRTLRPVPTEYSARLTDLGDTSLLGEHTTMRDALVGGDREVVVAATLLQADDTFALDLVVLNRQDQPLQLVRSDLQVVDAHGRWLQPADEWKGGDAHGLRGSRVERTREQVVYDVGPSDDFEHSRLMQNLQSQWGATPQDKQPIVPRNDQRRRVQDEDPTLGAQPELTTTEGSPARVVVPPTDGRVFWSYFAAGEEAPAFPLTALVVVDGEQILFRFDR